MTVRDQEKLEQDIANAKTLLEANGYVVSTKHLELRDLGIIGMSFISSSGQRLTDEKITVLRKMFAVEISHIKGCAHCQAEMESFGGSLPISILNS